MTAHDPAVGDLAAALAAIQRPHTALGPVETTFGTYRIRCQGCDFRETTDWSHQAENAHAEHVAALQVTYLRGHLTEHAEELGRTVTGDRLRCCLCEGAASTIVGGNALCGEHLAEAQAEAESAVAEDVRADLEKDPNTLRHNPFDANCRKHSTHPVRADAVCEICSEEP